MLTRYRELTIQKIIEGSETYQDLIDWNQVVRLSLAEWVMALYYLTLDIVATFIYSPVNGLHKKEFEILNSMNEQQEAIDDTTSYKAFSSLVLFNVPLAHNEEENVG